MLEQTDETVDHVLSLPSGCNWEDTDFWFTAQDGRCVHPQTLWFCKLEALFLFSVIVWILGVYGKSVRYHVLSIFFLFLSVLKESVFEFFFFKSDRTYLANSPVVVVFSPVLLRFSVKLHMLFLPKNKADRILKCRSHNKKYSFHHLIFFRFPS